MPEDILRTIAAATRKRVEAAKARLSPELMKSRALQAVGARNTHAAAAAGARPFAEALAKDGMSFICECKKASPSKGIIAQDFDYLRIAREYAQAGASAISCLTEPQWFKGDIAYLREIAEKIDIPVLRKDFIIDEYMIYEAAANGAAAVLLICSLLSFEDLVSYSTLADELGMSALVEAHTSTEITKALKAGAGIIGVNNRNLADFSVDFENSIRLRSLVPDSVLFVAESGVKTPEDVKLLYDNGVDAVLIGETLMRARDKRAMLNTLRSAL